MLQVINETSHPHPPPSSFVMRRSTPCSRHHSACSKTLRPHPLLALLLLLLLLLPSTTPADKQTVTFGVILPMNDTYLWSMQKTRFAVEFAIQSIEESQLLPGINLTADYRDSKCSETDGPLEAIDMYTKKTAQAFLGPACDYAVAPIARFTTRWEIPVLTAGALVQAFQLKTEYRLLTRLMGSYVKLAECVTQICRHFDWTNAGIMYEDAEGEVNSRSDWFFIAEAMFYAQRELKGGEPWYNKFDKNKATRPQFFRHFLREAQNETRIVVLCASPDSVRDIMIQAHELNFDNGEYVFFNIDLFTGKHTSERPWYREDDTAERNDKARKAYEALMTVTLRKPTSPEYKQFSKTVKAKAMKMYKADNFTYDEDEVNSFVGAFHDAVILYALALNESLEAGVSITNGTEITHRMWNRTFQGITGTVSIDANGDRNADYSLLDMDPSTGTFHVVANYYGNKKQYEPVPGRSIAWAGGRTEPPTDTPECGFDGSKCPPDEPFPEYGIVIIVLGSIILIVLVAAFFIYRKWECNKREETVPDNMAFRPLNA